VKEEDRERKREKESERRGRETKSERERERERDREREGERRREKGQEKRRGRVADSYAQQVRYVADAFGERARDQLIAIHRSVGAIANAPTQAGSRGRSTNILAQQGER